ncbi:MAG: hypothetical protein Q9210_001542 [Variospora velana]
MALRAKNRLPNLNNGDVEIWLTRRPEDRFLLRSVVLGLYSPWFSASLSERWAWSAQLQERAGTWIYQREFDTDGTAVLIKKSSPPAPVDTSVGSHLAIYINRASASVQTSTSAPIVDPIQSSKSEDKARTHVAWVNAHRSYFLVGGDPFQALEALHLTVAVGDLYNGPQVLATQTENLLVKHFQAFSIYLFQHARLVLDIALRAEIHWLFTDVVCHLAGDEKRDDQDIQDELDPRMAALVLKKRESLRRMMRDIDRELLLFKTLSHERSGATLASACF